MSDGRTPTLINAFMVATKVVLVLVCAATIDDPAHMAEALTVATSASYLVGAVAGHVLLSRRLGHLGFASVANTAVRIGAASVMGGAAAWAVVLLCEHGLGRGHVGSLTALLAGAVVGLAVLGVVASRLRLPELEDIRAMVRR